MFSKLKGRMGSRRGCLSGLFSRSRNQCGNSCAYFQEAVGHEYGTDGMQSYVSGCGSVVQEGSVNPSQIVPVPSVEAHQGELHTVTPVKDLIAPAGEVQAAPAGN